MPPSCAHSEKSCVCLPPILQMKQLRFKILMDSSGSHCKDKGREAQELGFQGVGSGRMRS